MRLPCFERKLQLRSVWTAAPCKATLSAPSRPSVLDQAWHGKWRLGSTVVTVIDEVGDDDGDACMMMMARVLAIGILSGSIGDGHLYLPQQNRHGQDDSLRHHHRHQDNYCQHHCNPSAAGSRSAASP